MADDFSPDDEPRFRLAQTLAFIRDEQGYLWGLLWDAYQRFLETTWMGRPQKQWQEGGTWSGRCEGLGDRIKVATEIAGPVPWQDIPMTALVDGWFAWANARLGIDAPLPEVEDIDRMRALLAEEVLP